MHYYIPTIKKSDSWFSPVRLIGLLFLLTFIVLMAKIWVPYAAAAVNATAITFLPPEWAGSYIAATLPKTARTATGNKIIIQTSNLHIEAPIVDGVTPADLLKGVGHDPASSVPGAQGRVILSGHRFWPDSSPYATIFFSLDKLKVGDKININYNSNEYVYRVSEQWDVPKDEAYPHLAPTTDSILTIYTCGPTPYSAKHRLGFNAVLESSPVKQEAPKALDTLQEGVL